MWVQTDRSGVAQVYYQLGDAVGGYVVTANLQGTPTSISKTFDATAVDASRSASLVLVSGNNQRSDADTHDVEDPLVVRVRRPGGYRIAGVKIRFTALSGVLARAPGTLPPTTEPIGPSSGQEIYGLTNAHGEAGVVYNTGQIAGAKTVTARVDDELSEEQYNYQIRQVEFNIDGSGRISRPPADDEDEDEDVPSVTIDVPTTVTGTAGGTETLTVTAPATARVTPGGSGDTFPLANAGSFTRSGTTYTSRLTLPNQVADYGFSVFVGDTRYRVTVSVTAAAVQTGTLTVAVNPFSGAPGTTATVTVTAADASAQPANATVNLTATGGTLSNPSVATGIAGTTTVNLIRGSTAGNENYVTVSATNYTTVRSRFIIAGPAPRDMTVGAAAEVDVYDGNNQDGSLNSRLADPFIVEVVDANDNPVEDVRVRFSTTIGSGRFRLAAPRTDEDGLAETPLHRPLLDASEWWRSVAGADAQRRSSFRAESQQMRWKKSPATTRAGPQATHLRVRSWLKSKTKTVNRLQVTV